MSNSIHLIMPMAGRGSRFAEKGFNFPKPLISIYGKPFFYWSTQSIRKFVKLESLDFVVLQEHVDKYDITDEILYYFPESRIHILTDVTEGAVITSMSSLGEITDNLPVVFNDCDHLFKSLDFNMFCNSNESLDALGALLTFKSNEPKYSFVEKDSNGNINRTVEKVAVSDDAICGCYYFRNKDLFISAAQEYLDKCSYSEYFMSGVYNIMIDNNQCVRSIKTDYHIPFGTPEEYEIAKLSDKYEELV